MKITFEGDWWQISQAMNEITRAYESTRVGQMEVRKPVFPNADANVLLSTAGWEPKSDRSYTDMPYYDKLNPKTDRPKLEDMVRPKTLKKYIVSHPKSLKKYRMLRLRRKSGEILGTKAPKR